MFRKILFVGPSAITRNFSICELSNEHKILQATCRAFAEKELRPIAGNLDREGSFPKEQIDELAKLGLMRVTVAPEYGGAGMDLLALSLIVEEISRGCGGTGAIVSIHNCLYANLMDRLGTKSQKEKFLKNIPNNVIGAFALSESDAGSDVVAMSTHAKKNGDSWILNGSKSWVTSGVEAMSGVIFATIDPSLKHKGITAFILNLDGQGVTRGKNENKMGIKASSTCNLHLNDVRVHEENVLGGIGNGFKIAMEQLDRARIGIASQALGIAQASLDTAVEYAKQRKAFGQSIVHLPSVQIRLAEMAIKIESARLLTRKAAMEMVEGKKCTKSCSMAKLAASECATFSAHNCQQILGGVGYVNEFPAERYYRDARITEIYGGVTDVQKLVIADQLVKEYDL